MDNKELARSILAKKNELGIVKAGSVGEVFTLACIADALDEKDRLLKEYLQKRKQNLKQEMAKVCDPTGFRSLRLSLSEVNRMVDNLFGEDEK